MYWYISFLRPPPVSVSSSADSIIITPQVANDLRTELRYDPTPISYTWQQTHPSQSALTQPTELTTFAPPSSTYRPLSVPLPPSIKSGDRWRLGLFLTSPAAENIGGTAGSHGEEAGPSSGLLALSGPNPSVLGVWSEPISIVRPDISLSSGNLRTIGGKLTTPMTKRGNGEGKNRGKGQGNEVVKGKGKGREKEKDETVKQGRIWREWGLPLSAEEDGAGDVGARAVVRAKLRIIEQTSFDLDKKIWDSGLALSSWLYRHLASSSSDMEGLHPLARRVFDLLNCQEDSRFLELGSGTGLVSIALALAYLRNSGSTKHIIATDLDSAIPLMKENLALSGFEETAPTNATECADDAAEDAERRTNRASEKDHNISPTPRPIGVNVSVSVEARVLDWERPLPYWVAEHWPELIIAADVTYNTSSFPSLLTTLTSFLCPDADSNAGPLDPPNGNTTTSATEARPPPLLLLAYKQRDPGERELWELLSGKGIDMIKVDSVVGAEGLGQGLGQGEYASDGTVEIWVGGQNLAGN